MLVEIERKGCSCYLEGMIVRFSYWVLSRWRIKEGRNDFEEFCWSVRVKVDYINRYR